jgi:hypothetical protein
VDIQLASRIDQYVTADSSALATPSREAAGAPEPEPAARVSGSAEDPQATAEPAAAAITPGVYARNARPVMARMSAPSISLLA